MAKLQVVIAGDGEAYYLFNEKTGEETADSVEWGMKIEFEGKIYVADLDDAGEVELFLLTQVDGSKFEAVSEADDEAEDTEEGAEEDEEEESAVE